MSDEGLEGGADHAVTATDILPKLNVREAERLKQGDRFATVCSIDFEEEIPTVSEVTDGVLGDGAIEQERVFVGHKKGQRRLMIEHRRCHLACLMITDVGRVADDDFERRC